MNRRKFLTLFGGGVAAGSLAFVRLDPKIKGIYFHGRYPKKIFAMNLETMGFRGRYTTYRYEGVDKEFSFFLDAIHEQSTLGFKTWEIIW